MASILERAGIAEDLFDAMSIFAGNLRGGVAVQTVVVAVILAAMSGVMGGEIVMLGLVALPQMFRLGYDRKLTIGLICASGELAVVAKSEEHTSELQSLMRISYAVFCLKKKKNQPKHHNKSVIYRRHR